MTTGSNSIFVVIRSLRGGGSERVCVNLCNSLTGQGIKVNLIVLDSQNDYLQLLDPSIKIFNLNTLNVRRSLFSIHKFIKNNNPTKIISFNFQISILLVIRRILFGGNFKIISRHINNLSGLFKDKNFWHGRIVPLFVKIFYNKVDLVIAQADAMKFDLVNAYNLKDEQVIVIKNPVSPIFLNSPIIPFNEREDKLLFVGQLRPQKRVDVLIEIYCEVLKRLPNIKLQIVGDGPLKKDIINQAKSRHVFDKIDFIDFTNEVKRFYSNAKLLLLTSDYEGFPNVIIESMASGTPVISFDCPTGPNEIIKQSVNGFLIKPNDINGFSEAIYEALKNKSWDLELVRESANPYKAEEIVKQYQQLLQN